MKKIINETNQKAWACIWALALGLMASSGSQLNSWVGRAQIYKAINNNQLQAKVAAL